MRNLKVNNIPVENVTYNGVELNELQYNGVVVWRREQPTEKEYMYVEIANIFSALILPVEITFSNYAQMNNLEYSINNIDDWKQVENGVITTNSIKGTKVYLRADNVKNIGTGIGMIKVDWSSSLEAPPPYQMYFNVGGDARSLLSRENFENTPLTDFCYQNMFWGCANLVEVDENFLRSTTLASNCYQQMFRGTSIKSAPKLPATTLAFGCYQSMFRECTSLTNAPTLLSTTLSDACYNVMFKGCSSLTSVTTYATKWNSSNTTNWLDGVASTGVVYAPNGATNIPLNSPNGVPRGWSLDTTPIN